MFVKGERVKTSIVGSGVKLDEPIVGHLDWVGRRWAHLISDSETPWGKKIPVKLIDLERAEAEE
jgi:hypothetical protein